MMIAEMKIEWRERNILKRWENEVKCENRGKASEKDKKMHHCYTKA